MGAGTGGTRVVCSLKCARSDVTQLPNLTLSLANPYSPDTQCPEYYFSNSDTSGMSLAFVCHADGYQSYLTGLCELLGEGNYVFIL